MPARLRRGELGVINTRRRASGRWQATAGMRLKTGEWKQLTKTADTEAGAIAQLEDEHVTLVGRGTRRMSAGTTVEEMLDSWVRYAASAKPQSIVRYRSDASTIRDVFGATTLVSELHAADIDSHLLSLVEDGLASAARRLRKRILSALRHADALGAPAGEATKLMAKLPEQEKKESRVTPEGWARILDTMEDWGGGYRKGGRKVDWQRLRDVLTLCLHLGARVGEVLSLQPGDIDWERGRVLIRTTQVIAKGTGPVRQEHTKKRETRSLKVSDSTLDVLRRRIAMGSGAWVIEGAAGKMLAEDRAQKAMRAFREATPELWESLGIPLGDVTTHLMRRSAATAVEREHGIGLASSMLGHSNEVVTRGSYVVTRSEVPESAAETMGKFEAR